MSPAPKTAQRPKRETILGIDPGSLVTGWGVIEAEGNRLHYTAHGIIATSPALAQAERLKQIYRGIQEVIRRYRPVVVSLEKVFFSRNVQSALKLGQARGIAMLAAAENEIPRSEYSATEIKVGRRRLRARDQGANPKNGDCAAQRARSFARRCRGCSGRRDLSYSPSDLSSAHRRNRQATNDQNELA